MVQVISLLDTKDLKPQKTNTKVDTNVDFLELLMKDIKENKSINDKDNEIVQLDEPKLKDFKIDKLKDFSKDAEKKEDTKDNLNDLNIEIDSKQKVEIKNLELFLNQQSINKNEQKSKDLVVQEVKNIIDSKMKQENILLTKSEIKEFKKIDNIKDLIKFADKKGLNIQNIKVEIPKNYKNTEITDKENKPKNNLNNINFFKSDKKIDTDNKSNFEKKEVVTLEDVLKKDLSSKKSKTNKITKHEESKIQKYEHKKIDNKNIKKENIPNLQKELNIPKENNINLNVTNNEKNIKTNKTTEHKIDLNTLLNKKIDKKQPENSNSKIDNVKIDIKDEKKVKIEPKTENIINNNLNNVNEVKIKSIQAKQTIDSFKNNLDEAIKNYKPPVSKVNIELNPQNLGKVEVTIIQRGNNIQVNMNTDQNNIALFQQHQAEFRQALSNIGFSNIDMSFNSNQDRDRRQNQAKKTYKDNEKIEDIGEIEIKANYKYA